MWRGDGVLVLGILVEGEFHARTHALVEEVERRYGALHDKRREEGGYDTDGHDDGVEEWLCDLEVFTEFGNDEGELTHLYEGETCLHGHAERLSR